MSHTIHKEDDDAPPGLPPPTYEEALNSSAVMPGGPGGPGAPGPQHGPPSHPPSHPPRPQQGISSPAGPPPRPSAASGSSTAKPSLYSNNANLPFDYPRGHLCSKCKNTGFKERKGKPCSSCWFKFGKQVSYNPNPKLSFTYPKGFICEKCCNTGTKIKNGLSCKDCYARFAPRNNASQTPVTYAQPASFNMFSPSYGYGNSGFGPGPGFGPVPGPGPAGYGPPVMPQYVQPGDPRIGGTLCGRCRGTGQVSFFLDQELCSICGGMGRLFNNQHAGFR